MFSIRKFLTAAAIAALAILPVTVSAATVADWQFNEDSVKSGTIADKNLIIEDKSGNGNDLQIRTYGANYKKTVSFSDESFDSASGSIFLNGYGALKSSNPNEEDTGVDFVTVSNAPINKNRFENGYTIEIIYKMPDDWIEEQDKWTSLIARLAPSSNAPDVEDEKVSMSINVSSCKEIQVQPRDKDGDAMGDIWSIAMDKAENWYHIVIIGDNNGIRTFVNGCESFRDYNGTVMQGLYADSADGRFRIGSKTNASGALSRWTRGNFQRIRISDTALNDRNDWIIPNPEEFIGEYGSNDKFAETEDGRYNMIFVPDTQNATKFRGDVLDRAFNWIVENEDYANIEAVVSLGDNVEDYDQDAQWKQIEKNYSFLAENGIRTIVPAGNHDSGGNHGVNNYGNYIKNFGPGSNFDSLADNYMIEYSPSATGGVADISAGSFAYKLVYIDMFKLGDSAEIAWLRGTLEKYSNCPVILMMHDIQNCSNTVPNETMLSANGVTLWNIAKAYDNVFLMVGGHSHGYGVLELTNNYGNKVYSVLADYQFSYNGGNALCKFAEFDEKENMIRISTFSPYAATLSPDEKTFFDVNFMTGKGHYDEISIDFMERFGNLVKGYKVTGENLITNGSFENAEGDFSLEGWNSAQTGAQFGDPYTTGHCFAVNATTTYTFDYWGSKTLKETALATKIPDGNWAFGSKWSDPADGLCSIKRYVPVTAGKTYQISYMIKSKNTGNCEYIKTSLVANYGDGESNTTTPGIVGPEWTRVTRVFTATDETDYVLFWFRWMGGEGEGPFLFFDDFQICEVEPIYADFTMNVNAVKDSDKVTVTFDYNEKSDHNFFIVAGFDKEGKLINIASTNKGEATLTGASIDTVKVLYWSDILTVTPLTTAKSITLE